jgi:beta-phosphoglucomutase-like phosphatase (HAD superfamily)
LKIEKGAAPPFTGGRFLLCLNLVCAFKSATRNKKIRVRHPPELFHHFKLDPEVYLGAADMLGCKPAEVMMVAAHPGDLKAAEACGLRTGFVARPPENGAGRESASLASFPADVSARDFLELAEKLA